MPVLYTGLDKSRKGFAMPQASERYIPASTLSARLEKIRAKTAALSEQIEDLRREEKLLGSLLEEAVEGSTSAQAESAPMVTEAKTRAKGVVEAIVEAIQSKPGLTRDELVDGLKYLNLNPFDHNAARRTILNNLGNQMRSGKVRENERGGLTLTEAVNGSVK